MLDRLLTLTCCRMNRLFVNIGVRHQARVAHAVAAVDLHVSLHHAVDCVSRYAVSSCSAYSHYTERCRQSRQCHPERSSHYTMRGTSTADITCARNGGCARGGRTGTSSRFQLSDRQLSDGSALHQHTEQAYLRSQ